jgi:hypothetical protein
MTYEAIDDDATPQSPGRVAARAIVMTTVTCRSFLEDESDDVSDFWAQVRRWFDRFDLAKELEGWEQRTLDAPLGHLERQDYVNAQWAVEGLAVLAWALGKIEPLRFDEAVVPGEIVYSLGLLEEEDFLAKPMLRPVDEIQELQARYFSAHWRLREFSLRSRGIDFVNVAATTWFGPLLIEGLPIRDNDLEIGGLSISESSDRDRQLAMSIVMERHRAANWLLGDSTVYSETETNT